MMAETLTPLIIATVAFVGSHFLMSAIPVRSALIRAMGRIGFTILYSVVALATFLWMVHGFTHAPLIDLWPGVAWARWVALVVMLFACVLLVCGVLTPNPTAVMIGVQVIKRGDAAAGIFKVTRHPIMWAVTLWAAVHMLNTGDAAALILFSALGFLAFVGMWHSDVRRDAEGDPHWQRFRAQTSFLPFAAIYAGRTRVTMGEIGWIRMGLGVVVYLLMLHAHGLEIGIDVAPWR